MDPDQFICRWQPSDADAIRFAWNGKHGKDLVDGNSPQERYPWEIGVEAFKAMATRV
jgi:hypothetical protein